MLSYSREGKCEARYKLISDNGISFGSFNQLERAIHYRDALWRLRGLKCTIQNALEEIVRSES